MKTIFGRAISAWCALGRHALCDPTTNFLHHMTGQGGSYNTRFKAKCNCHCHSRSRGNIEEGQFDRLLHALSAHQADKPPATREKAKEPNQ